MGEVEFELQRTLDAPVAEVFARPADIEGHNRWMPRKGSIRRQSRQTSPGPPQVGTTYEDVTVMGTSPGEIVELEPPHRLVYHWWDATSSGKLEGGPGYTLEGVGVGVGVGVGETVVRHHARLRANGILSLATPVLTLVARRERTTVLDALQKSLA